MEIYEDNETNTRKAKRNKKETVCSVKRHRHDGCGICGSQNVLDQGVTYCKKCEKEIDFISDRAQLWWWRKGIGKEEDDEPNCTCTETITFGRKHETRTFRPIRTISVKKCTDCGSVRGGFCPNCGKKDKSCWRHWNGSLYCQKCGYRINC